MTNIENIAIEKNNLGVNKVAKEINADFVISGAGPIGLSMALSLVNADLPLSIILLDQFDFEVHQIERDSRMIALSERSIRFFKSLNVWDAMKTFSTPIKSVHISEQKVLSTVLISSDDYELEQLGAVVPYIAIVNALITQIKHFVHTSESSEFQVIKNAKIETIVDKKISKYLSIGTNESQYLINASYLIAADGAFSNIRDQLGFESLRNDYDQVAVIGLIECQKSHNNMAYERFTLKGPLALLPNKDNQMAVILTVPRETKEKWKTATDDDFMHEILHRFGKRLGNIKSISTRQIWSLALILPKEIYKNQTFLIGNSAHALHPIAGQGLNLGIRDIIELMDLLREIKSLSLLTENMCVQFSTLRKKDILQTVGATDFLVQIFGVNCLPVGFLRAKGLMALGNFPIFKDWVAKFGMGLHR